MFALYVGGLRDYLLILIGDTDYIEGQFGPGGLAYFTDYPPVLRALWAINVLGGLIAPVLLVARNRWAAPTALLAAAAQLVLLAVTFALLDRWTALGASTSWFDIGIGLVTVLFALYCTNLRRRDLLR
ncbi:hypothetical protein SAMN05660874_04101 [Saccharopolyspora flava]|uniref:Uncharacterized protein n=1 Tax=Saccharopolyspora flava TaxID=95161 RepID=A0A1I6TMS6_9PSEU|nr:hypothetical protein SAMN05660874_04101 [Saccharopolyspora flava]